jgi:hypothetical protein
MRSTVWARSTEGYYWKLGDPPRRAGRIHSAAENNVVPFNLARSEDAQRRIRETVKRLESEGQLPPTATARLRAIVQQGISSRTLYRHLELWHPTHDQSDRTRTCKTSEPEIIPAPFGGDFAKIVKSPESFNSKEVYTSEENMKSGDFDLGFASAFGLGLGLGSTSFDHSLQLLESPRHSESLDSSQRDFSTHLFELQPSLTETLSTILPANNDRAWVLVKLLQLWMDGYQNFVRLLRKRK